MKCEQPGCAPAGEIDPDGYCDRCGMAPSGPRPAATAASTPIVRSERPEATRSVPTRSVTRSISSRARLGGGIVELPTQPEYDPATAVITEPSVVRGEGADP